MTKANFKYHAREKRYLEVIENWVNDENDSITECARYHHLKPKNFQRRVNENRSKFIRFQSQNRLNEDQEVSLFHYLKRLDDMNMSSISKLVVEAAKSEASVQQPKIDEKTSENGRKNYLFDHNVMRFNELIATTTLDYYWDINTLIELFKTPSFNRK